MRARAAIAFPHSRSGQSAANIVFEMIELKLDIERVGTVSALLTELAGSQPRACFVFAHGAAAGMMQAFMQRTGRIKRQE